MTPPRSMIKDAKHRITPKLRFPEFRDAPGWEACPLRELAEFVGDRVSVSELNRADYVSTENLLPDFGGFSLPSSFPAGGSVVRYRVNDILAANIRPYLKKIWLADRNGGASNDVIVIRAQSSIDHQYLSHVLQNDRFIAYVMSGAKGLKMPRGDVSLIREYPVPTPFPAEQHRIASCLSSLDDLIAAERQKLDALKAHTKGLMQQLFPRKGETLPRLRFPEFRDALEWEEKKVGEIFRVTRGQVLAMGLVRETKTHDAPFPVYSSQTKNAGLCGFYSEHLYRDAITWTTDGANAGDVNYRSGQFYCTNVCGVLLNTEGYANQCIAALLGNVSRKHVSYVGNPKLMNGVMSEIPIPVPSVAEQHRIASFISTLDDLIAAQNDKVEALMTHKKGLMQQLFPCAAEVEP